MGNKDINLFSAGSERIKNAKHSPLTTVVAIALLLVIIAIGVMVYFNMQTNTAKQAYEKKVAVQRNYERTKNYVLETAEEYNNVKANIEYASLINRYIEQESALYPQAKAGEIEAVKQYILESDPTLSFNDITEEEPFEAWDYEELRKSLYDEETADDIEDKELFYYALEVLAAKQAESPDVNVWNAYYRGYLVVCFTGDVSNLFSLYESLFTQDSLKYTVIENEEEKEIETSVPFSRFRMTNELYPDSGEYSPALFCSKIFGEDITYNVLLLPMKSVIERAIDILETRAAIFREENEEPAFGVDTFKFTNDTLEFELILTNDETTLELFTAIYKDFNNSGYFTCDNSVSSSSGSPKGDTVVFPIKLHYVDEMRIVNAK